MQIKAISMVKIDEKWKKQEEIPEEEFREILRKIILRAAASIGAEVTYTA